METGLTGSHRSTYEAIFQHPLARNLEWRDLRAMLDALPHVLQEEHNGILKVSCHGKTVVLHGPVHKHVASVEELMRLQRFLEHSKPSRAQPADEGTHLLVVINHREARIFRAELHGSVPQRITPYDSGHSGRHLHYVQDDSNGQRKPERKSFYEAVAKALQGARHILILGSGTGASSAMEHLVIELTEHHPNVAGNIAGWVAVNEQHMSDDQLLARARQFYSEKNARISQRVSAQDPGH